MLEGGNGHFPPMLPPPPDRRMTVCVPRRICPGKPLALRTIYLVVACVLSVFDIGPALDGDGNPQMPKIEFDDSTLRYVFFFL